MNRQSDRIEELARELASLRERVEWLEGSDRSGARARSAPDAPIEALRGPPAVEEPAQALAALASARGLALAGRTFVAFGGAFFLRALTDGNVLSPPLGAGAGLLYAAALLWLADGAAARGDRASAGFHGLASTVIAFSLIWETSTRLGILPPIAGAALLAVFIALGLAVARRRQLRVLGWMTTLCAALASLALIWGAPSTMPFIAALFALGAATETLAFDDRWLGLRWPAALALDLALFHLANLAVHPEDAPPGSVPLAASAVVVAELALPSLYLVSVAARSIVRGRLIAAFGMGQSVMALAVGLWGAARVLGHHDRSLAWVGAVAVLLGAIGYAVAFGHARRVPDRQRNYYFYATVGLLLVLSGAPLMVPAAGALDWIWWALAIAAAAYGVRGGTVPRLHAAVYGIAASLTGGLLGAATQGLVAPASAAWGAVGTGHWAALVASFACYALLLSARSESPGTSPVILPRIAAAAITGWAAIGLASALAARTIAGAGGSRDAAVVATARTAVLAISAAILAWCGRRWSLRELTWMVYPVLVGGAVKILVEDLPHGRPATLVVTLGCYGGALILASRQLAVKPAQSGPMMNIGSPGTTPPGSALS